MRHDKDQRGRALDGFDDVWNGDDVLREGSVRQVFLVDVSFVDNLGQLLPLKLVSSADTSRENGRVRSEEDNEGSCADTEEERESERRSRTSSSKTQMGVRSSNRSECFFTFCPAILAIADPLNVSFRMRHTLPSPDQLPEPIMATFSLPIVEMYAEEEKSRKV